MMDKTLNNAVSIKLADYTVISSAERVDRAGWINYGVNNLFPQYLRELAQTGAVHGSLCISIGDMMAGKALEAGIYTAQVNGLSTYDVFYGCAHDLKKYGGYYIEVIYSFDRASVAKLRHIPFEECRIAVETETEEICGIYHSNDWAATKKKRNRPEFIPLFNVAKKAEEPRQIYYCYNYTSGQYYPRPDYYSAINSIELAKEISVYHINNIVNGLTPSFIVSMFQGAPSPDDQRQIKNDWERQLTGARNAGKFIMTFNERDTPKPDITTFPLSDADKQYQFLSEESTSLIMVAHRVTTPLLFGIRSQSGFGSNKDEMAVGLEIFTNQVIEPAQRKLAKGFEEVLGWAMPGISIQVIPNTPLAESAHIMPTATDTATPTVTDTSAADVAGTALNGAQIASMVDILVQAATGVLPIDSAKGVMRASFPTLTDQQIEEIFSGIKAGAIDPNAVAMTSFKTFLSHVTKQKKKVCCSDNSINVELESAIAEELISLGEDAPEGYILIDSYEVDYETDDAENEELIKIAAHELASTGSAKPMMPSEQDETNYAGITFMTRYRYGGYGTGQREFCAKMLTADKLYRKEDIVAMEAKAVNPGWGPHGASTYDIWLYKGGGNCHHFWKKEVYINASGINPLANDAQKIAVSKAAKMGYKVQNNELVALLPVDMDYNGFLEDNPVYGKDGINYRR